MIAGVARGRRLAAPGAGTRPLTDRLKQSLFAIIEPEIRDRAFLDLFAGSGAAGIEALSRGAASAVFVEKHPGAVHMVERNLRTSSLLGARARIVPKDVIGWLSTPDAQTGTFAAILVDPPYDRPDLLRRTVHAVAEAGPGAILATDGVLIAKHFRKDAPSGKVGLLRSDREERFGDTMLTFYRWSAVEGEEDR
ncbi:MAG TPA: 16S rRNA (guanine(966)-N(2))-methyltransferase RsmD [Candidatus Limnocylindrales bacterium]|nr:16S rRNA (guanine(966)-N(2))-methyltransferase RsmD [Candidatus Limnocylindrales bacterium]